MPRRVVITGAGTINPLGHDVAATFDAMRNGRCGIGPLDIRDVDRLSIQIGGQVRDYDETTHFNRQQIALYDRFTQFTLLAARQAIAQAGLVFAGDLADQSGVILGTSGGGLNTQDENYRVVYEEGKNRVHPFIVPKLMNNAAVSQVSMEFNLRGPSFTVATACASSNHAMGQAFNMVRSGMAKVMVTGGSESMLCFGGIKAWEGLRVMSRDACRPFSATRNGMVQGEGAGVFVFEDYYHAKARGAHILCEVAGFAMSSDASDIVMPSKQGAARAIAGALKDAKVNPDQIGYINAHGTSTPVGDVGEIEAVRRVFGAGDTPPVSSTKSMTGHSQGATGAQEAIYCLLMLEHDFIAPSINVETLDPALDAAEIATRRVDNAGLDTVMTNSFGFGGTNGSMLISKFQG